ncbi:helix-turn-helix domain-containing protein, partial [Phaeovulum sp.]|uniref:helix-turn-helix domain-containing protein n=1 Tax=Phaeovulum sp. TaxID=2934796 RepID=UPI003561C77D
MPKSTASDTPQATTLPANPALRDVFGQNLRILAKGEDSISATCRALGINRTQFNRYLTGSAFPRPDVLHRICTHFGVDARILLEPLALEKEPRMTDELARVLHSMVDAPLDFRVDQTLLPSGIYRIWRRSFLSPDRAMVSISRVYRDGLVTRMKSYEPYLTSPGQIEMSCPPRLPCHGLFLRAEDGVMLLTMFPRTRM